MSSWRLECGGGDPSSCLDPMETQLFPVSSSVTFTDVLVDSGPPKTRCSIITHQVLMKNLKQHQPDVLCPSPGSRSTSQSMTVTGMMYAGQNLHFLLPDITQVIIIHLITLFTESNSECKGVCVCHGPIRWGLAELSTRNLCF